MNTIKTEEELCEYFKNKSLKWLYKLKNKSDESYYNNGVSDLEDWQYDFLIEVLKVLDKNYTDTIGNPLRETDNRVKLPFFLGSMNKLKNDGISKWLTEYKKPYIIEEKLDGISCLICISKDDVKMYTRGDGYIGGDISHILKHMDSMDFLKTINIPMSVRGELIIKKSVFDEKFKGEYSNPRNMISGVVNSKTSRSGIKYIEFIAYEIIEDVDDTHHISQKPSIQLDRLYNMGFKIVNNEIIDDNLDNNLNDDHGVNDNSNNHHNHNNNHNNNTNHSLNLNNNSLVEILARFRSTSKYEIDGIIVQSDRRYQRLTSGNPPYAFAFKVRLECFETTVKNVEWNASKWGQLKPRIQVEPINANGVVISFATGFNAKYIYTNKIGKGTIVKITRSGDVIPYIVEIVKPSKKPDMPKDIEYTWNSTGVDIIVDGDLAINEDVQVKIITNFFDALGIKHVGGQTIRKLYNSGYVTIFNILSASQDDFEKIDGFQKKLAERTYQNIHQGLVNVKTPDLLTASGVFGFGLGSRKIKLLFEQIPDLLELYDVKNAEELTDMIIAIDGFSKKSAEKIIENLHRAIEFMDEISEFVTINRQTTTAMTEINDNITIINTNDNIITTNIASRQSKKNSKITGKKVVFSGFRDQVLENQIVQLGGKVTTSVSKNTDIVVYAETKTGKKSGKVLEAENLNIPVYDKQEFIRKILL
jgi:DNA ligase (NAD+)